MRLIFFSDTHLDKQHGERTRIVETFIREVCSGADIVFIVGDLFEFYHGHKGHIYPWYQGVADALKEITGNGCAVYFVEGNHEFGAGGFFESYTGAVCTDAMSIDVEGKKVFVSHGDEFPGGMVRTVLKSRTAAAVMDLLGPRLTWGVAMGARVFLSKKVKPYNKAVADIFRGHARKVLDRGYDVVVLGHTHMPDRMEYHAGEKEAVYLNTGDFIAYGSYVSYESGSGFELKTYRAGRSCSGA